MACLKYKNIMKRVLFSLVSLFLLGLNINLYSNSNKVTTKSNKIILAKEQVFNKGNYDEPDTLDPHKAFAYPDYNILSDIYEGLTTFDQNGKVILGQAASYTVSQDKKRYTFKLRNNLRWSNGDKLTAYDFEYAMKRAVDPQTGSQNYLLLKPIKNSKLILEGKLPYSELGVKALDELTLEIQLEQPIPYLLDLLSHNTFAPIYRPNVKLYGDKFTEPGIHVSNGPFKLSEWVVNSHLTLIKNHNYYNADQVILNKINFYPINQASAEYNRYRAGELDFTAKIPLDKINFIKSNYDRQLITSPILGLYYYSFNTEKQPFLNNKYLRKSLSLAIDKDIITDKILNNGSIATNRIVPDIVANYVNNPVEDDFNLKSKRLELARYYYNRAGYSSLNPLAVKLLFHTNESNKTIAAAVASMWQKNLGTKTELINQEWKVFLKTRLERHDTQIIREGWIASYNDPSALLELFESNNPQNSSGYKNVKYDDLLKRASEETDLNKRSLLLMTAENMLLEDAPIIPIYSPVSYHLVKPNIGGIHINMFDLVKDQYIYITKT